MYTVYPVFEHRDFPKKKGEIRREVPGSLAGSSSFPDSTSSTTFPGDLHKTVLRKMQSIWHGISMGIYEGFVCFMNFI